MKVVHMTSVHTRNDVRIFHKECKFLAVEGHNVFLVVADDKGDSSEGGVTIIDAGRLQEAAWAGCSTPPGESIKKLLNLMLISIIFMTRNFYPGVATEEEG